MLLLARFGASLESATTARIVAVSPSDITLESISAPGALRCDRLSFAAPAADLAGTQGQLMRLITNARKRAGERLPLTRIERETAHAATLETWSATVAAVSDIAPGLREITVSGLEGFESPGFDAFVYVIVPQGDSALPDDFKMAALRAWKGPNRPAGAYYTIRRSRPDELGHCPPGLRVRRLETSWRSGAHALPSSPLRIRANCCWWGTRPRCRQSLRSSSRPQHPFR